MPYYPFSPAHIPHLLFPPFLVLWAPVVLEVILVIVPPSGFFPWSRACYSTIHISYDCYHLILLHPTFLHLSTNIPTLIALFFLSCHPHFNLQPSSHSLTKEHFYSRWLFPLHSPHFFFSIFRMCCASVFLGRAALFGQPHRTCPISPHLQHLVGCTFLL